MLICLGYYPGDLHQAEHLAGWLKEIGPFPGHRLLIARDVRTPLNPFKDIGFDRMDEIVISDDVWNRWPESANNVFRKLATHIELVDKAPYWLMLEPDVVLLDQSGFNQLEREYIDSGKPFSLDLVSVPGVEIHGSGVGIYPGQLTHFAGEAKLAMGMAWDMTAKDQIVPQMHTSPHILHAWRHPTFENWEAVEREVLAIKPEVVLFHASKDGSMINLLRERRRQPTSEPMRTQTTSILIKSYPPDYQLLKYSLQSIEKYARGFEEVILVVPEDHIPHEVSEVSLGNLLNIIALKEESPGYAFQQAIKANAHSLTNSEYIAHIDSDTAFTCPVSPDTFFYKGKPLWMITPYEQTAVPWRAATEAFIGHKLEYEYMRRLPMFVPRKVHEKMARFCLQTHGMDLHRYIMQADHFSEFNALGAIAWDFFRDEIYWFDTSVHPEAEWPPLVALQTWSHAPLAENIEKFKAIAFDDTGPGVWYGSKSPISGAGMEPPPKEEPLPSSASLDNGQGEPATADDLRDIEHPRQNIIPWANKEESEAEIKRLCAQLRSFQTCPQYKARVRMELACFQVIPGDTRILGMRKRRLRLGPNPAKPDPRLARKREASTENLKKARAARLAKYKTE